jgi:hypothetical protein
VRICTISCKFWNFFGFMRIAKIRDCFFGNIFIIRTFLMIRYFEKSNRDSCKPEKIPEFARFLLNSLEFALKNREKSCDFGRIYVNSDDFARIWVLVAALAFVF